MGYIIILYWINPIITMGDHMKLDIILNIIITIAVAVLLLIYSYVIYKNTKSLVYVLFFIMGSIGTGLIVYVTNLKQDKELI